MKKILFQGLCLVLFFFATWFALREIDWMHIFEVEKNTQTTEEKLGDLFWDIFRKSEGEVKDKKILVPVDSLLSRICSENDIDRNQVKLHVVESDEINAFALPGGHLVIFTGLINAAENEGELCGVIGHELAHIQMNHVMKKLVKEIGLSVLVSMTTGNGGSEAVTAALKTLSSSAYDRTLEKDADIRSVDYMLKAGLNPEHFADFLYKLSENEPEGGEYLSWISTHPASKERAEYIITYSNGSKPFNLRPVLSQKTWEELKDQTGQEKEETVE